MAKGMRRIVVDGQSFRWRFNDVLVVIPSHQSGPPLYVDWGWRDWLEPGEPGPEPRVVIPHFVAEAIRFAIRHGWEPLSGCQSLRLGYQAIDFFLADDLARRAIEESGA